VEVVWSRRLELLMAGEEDEDPLPLAEGEGLQLAGGARSGLDQVYLQDRAESFLEAESDMYTLTECVSGTNFYQDYF
jgi:hypothetical protein